jgi:hypothetical protein
MESEQIDEVLSEVSKILAKKGGRVACPSDQCSFDCDPTVQYLLKDHIRDNHKEEDDLTIDLVDCTMPKKLKTVNIVESSLSQLLHDESIDQQTVVCKNELKEKPIDWKQMEKENQFKIREAHNWANSGNTIMPNNAQDATVFSHQIYNDKTKVWDKMNASAHPNAKFKVVSCGKNKKSSIWSTMPDSGAQVSMAPMSLIDDLGLDFKKDCEPTGIIISGVGGRSSDLETRALKLWIHNPASNVWAAEIIYISRGHRVSLLSYDCLVKLKLIKKNTLNFKSNFKNCTASQLSKDKEGLCRSTQMMSKDGNLECKCPRRVGNPEGPKQEARDKKLAEMKNKFGEKPKPNELEEIREELSRFLRSEFMGIAFNQCETQNLQTMKVTLMKVHLKAGARPFQSPKPYPVPLNLKDETKRDIDMAVNMGIPESVPCGTLTPWCAPMLAIAKKLGGVRRVINYKALNKQCNRAAHSTEPTFKMSISVPSATQKDASCTLYFSSLDTWNGSHSIPLEENSKNIFTFITPWGRYRYRLAPQGFLGSGDHYTKAYDDIQEKMIDQCKEKDLFTCPVSENSADRNIRRCIDDTLIWANSIWTSFRQIWYIPKFCSQQGIVFNPKKMKLRETSLNIFSYHLDQTSLRPMD